MQIDRKRTSRPMLVRNATWLEYIMLTICSWYCFLFYFIYSVVLYAILFRWYVVHYQIWCFLSIFASFLPVSHFFLKPAPSSRTAFLFSFIFLFYLHLFFNSFIFCFHPHRASGVHCSLRNDKLSASVWALSPGTITYSPTHR